MTALLTATALFLSSSAFAKNEPLFIIEKPVNPGKQIQVFAPVTDCHIGKIDFNWISKGKTDPMKQFWKNGLEQKVVESTTAPANNRANCSAAATQAGTCEVKAIRIEDVVLVDNTLKDKYLIVKAQKTKSGDCTVGAYFDVEGFDFPVQVQKIKVEGSLVSVSLSNLSAKVRVQAVTVTGFNGSPGRWTCTPKKENKFCETTASGG